MKLLYSGKNKSNGYVAMFAKEDSPTTELVVELTEVPTFFTATVASTAISQI